MALKSLFRKLLRRASDAPDATPNPLFEYFSHNTGRLIDKWHHYFEIYHRHLASFRGRSPVVVEIGVSQGGSLQMWQHYFGPGARLVGIDVDPECRRFADDKTTILIGDQANRAFLAEVRRQVPHIDILIDDGGHTMAQQIATFEELYPHIQSNGIYLCEDVHTSFVAQFGGGVGREDTFLNYSKKLIDRLYGWYAGVGIDSLTRTTYSMHFYDSVVVIEKRPMQTPVLSQAAKRSF